MTTQQPDHAQGQGSSSNPFAGIPASDYVRDGVAFLLLVLALAMPWNMGTETTSNVGAVLVTLLSILSLALTYLGHAKVFGSSMTAAQVGLIRAAANLPYVVLVVVALVVDISQEGADWQGEGGIGFAAALGLAGAAIAGMPRKFESGTGGGTTLQRGIMRTVTVGLAVLWTALSGLNIVFIVAEYADLLDNGALLIAVILNTLILFGAFALLAFGLLRSSEVARTVAVAAGAIALGVVLVDWLTDWNLSGVGVESVHTPGFAVLGFLSLGAVASSHITADLMRPVDKVGKWLGSAVRLLAANAAIAVVVVLSTVLFLVADIGYEPGTSVAYILVMLLIATATVVAWSLARTGYAAQKTLVIAAVIGTLVLGVVAIVLTNALGSVGSLDVVYAFGIPVAVLVLLLTPTSLRNLATSPAAPDAPPPPASSPAPHSPPHPRADEAADPGTSASALYAIATTIPQLRATVAANPATYPDLVEWLGALGDPEIDAAIASRSD